MASGDTLAIFTVLHNEPPASINATLDTRNSHPVLDFDDTADEEAVFRCIMPQHYGGGGVTAHIWTGATTATGGNVVLQGALENCDGLDKDADDFAAFQGSGAVAVSGTSGIFVDVTVAFTDGGQMDSVGVGDEFRFKVRRDADDTSATDSVSGDIEISAIELRET